MKRVFNPGVADKRAANERIATGPTGVRFRSLLLAILCSWMIAGCGESRATQCRKIVRAMREAVAAQKFMGSGRFSLNQIAALRGKTAANLEKLEISDKKLNNIRLHLVAASREITIATGDVANRVGPYGHIGSIDPEDPAITRLDAANEQLQAVQQGLDSYCNGNKPDPALTSPPKEFPRK